MPGIGSFTTEDIKRIGILDSQTLTKDSKFGDATFLVSTRKEKDAIISFAGKCGRRRTIVPYIGGISGL